MRFIRHGLAAKVIGIVAAVLLAVVISEAPASAGHGGPNHWNKQGNARVNLYVVDRTGAAWPVGTAVTQWVNSAASTGADITAYYRTSCPGASGSSYCSPIEEYTDANPGGAAGCQGLRGCVIWTASGGHLVTARVWLNNTGAGDSTQRRTSACHEIGHAHGLATANPPADNHPTASDTCLRGIVPYNAGPNAHDANALFNVYNHSN